MSDSSGGGGLLKRGWFDKGKVENRLRTPQDEAFRLAHEHSDVDFESGSLHHTLGTGPTQAAPGDHNHNAGAGAGAEAGEFIFTAHGTLYPNCMWPDGSALSRTTFSALFAKIGTRYGAGDGATTFNIPDTRKRNIRGIADPVGNPSTDGVAFASRVHDHNFLGSGSTGLTVPGHSHGTFVSPNGAHTHVTDNQGAHGHTASSGTAGLHSHTNSSTTLTSQTNTATGGTSTRVTDTSHSHGMSSDGGHFHSIAVDAAVSHQHTAQSAGSHDHSVTSQASVDLTHSHALSGGASGHPWLDMYIQLKYQ